MKLVVFQLGVFLSFHYYYYYFLYRRTSGHAVGVSGDGGYGGGGYGVKFYISFLTGESSKYWN